MAVIITTHYIEEAKQANYVSRRVKIGGEDIKESCRMNNFMKKSVLCGKTNRTLQIVKETLKKEY